MSGEWLASFLSWRCCKRIAIVLAMACCAGCGEDDGSSTVVPTPSPDTTRSVSVAAADPVKHGGELFRRYACMTCHSVDGTMASGPTLSGIFGQTVTLADGRTLVRDETYIENAMTQPERYTVPGYHVRMPSYSYLSRDQLDALVAYIRSLNHEIEGPVGEGANDEG